MWFCLTLLGIICKTKLYTIFRIVFVSFVNRNAETWTLIEMFLSQQTETQIFLYYC